jgi:hypothetical protein
MTPVQKLHLARESGQNWRTERPEEQIVPKWREAARTCGLCGSLASVRSTEMAVEVLSGLSLFINFRSTLYVDITFLLIRLYFAMNSFNLLYPSSRRLL